MAVRGNAPTPTVPIADLVRLRDDWERMVRETNRAATAAAPGQRPSLTGEARARSTCAADLNDLILGRGHPSARRS